MNAEYRTVALIMVEFESMGQPAVSRTTLRSKIIGRKPFGNDSVAVTDCINAMVKQGYLVERLDFGFGAKTAGRKRTLVELSDTGRDLLAVDLPVAERAGVGAAVGRKMKSQRWVASAGEVMASIVDRGGVFVVPGDPRRYAVERVVGADGEDDQFAIVWEE